MGSWGPAIFSDDIASDVRREYQTLLAAGLADEEAEELLFAYYHDILNEDADDSVAFWLALSLCQWKLGRLSELVKQESLRLIDSGKAVTHWNPVFKEKKFAKRKAVLKDLRNILLSPMPSARKVQKPRTHHCPWKTGSLLAYRIATNEKDMGQHPCFGKYALLRVVRIQRQPVSRILPDLFYNEMMFVGAYGWIGDQIPDPSIADQLQYIALDESLVFPPSLFDTIASSTLPNNVKRDFEAQCKRKDYYYIVLSMSQTEIKQGLITCIGCDTEFESHIPEVFQKIGTPYTITSSPSLDICLAKRLERFLY